MAKVVVVKLVDDIDGTDAHETVTFALDGINYEIDLTSEHAAELRAAFAQWIGKGRRASGRKTTRAARPAAGGNSEAARIRKWAQERGKDVPARGRISAELRAEYLSELG